MDFIALYLCVNEWRPQLPDILHHISITRSATLSYCTIDYQFIAIDVYKPKKSFTWPKKHLAPIKAGHYPYDHCEYVMGFKA